jgi:hypothetical protein
MVNNIIDLHFNRQKDFISEILTLKIFSARFIWLNMAVDILDTCVLG